MFKLILTFLVVFVTVNLPISSYNFRLKDYENIKISQFLKQYLKLINLDNVYVNITVNNLDLEETYFQVLKKTFKNSRNFLIHHLLDTIPKNTFCVLLVLTDSIETLR